MSENRAKSVYENLLKRNDNTQKPVKVISFKLEEAVFEKLKLSVRVAGYENVSDFLRNASYDLINANKDKVDDVSKIINE